MFLLEGEIRSCSDENEKATLVLRFSRQKAGEDFGNWISRLPAAVHNEDLGLTGRAQWRRTGNTTGMLAEGRDKVTGA